MPKAPCIDLVSDNQKASRQASNKKYDASIKRYRLSLCSRSKIRPEQKLLRRELDGSPLSVASRSLSVIDLPRELGRPNENGFVRKSLVYPSKHGFEAAFRQNSREISLWCQVWVDLGDAFDHKDFRDLRGIPPSVLSEHYDGYYVRHIIQTSSQRWSALGSTDKDGAVIATADMLQELNKISKRIDSVESWFSEHKIRSLESTCLAKCCRYWSYHHLLVLRSELRLRWLHPQRALYQMFRSGSLPWQKCWIYGTITERFLLSGSSLVSKSLPPAALVTTQHVEEEEEESDGSEGSVSFDSSSSGNE